MSQIVAWVLVIGGALALVFCLGIEFARWQVRRDIQRAEDVRRIKGWPV